MIFSRGISIDPHGRSLVIAGYIVVNVGDGEGRETQ